MSREAGYSAEQLAAEFLTQRGFHVIERNFTVKGGEIDLVCDDAGTLVFVEVRARRADDFGAPEETISPAKRRRLILAARLYLLQRGIEDRACRFDVIAIEGEDVRYLPDAFQT
jgi:putative endonuclease